jgi:type I restriction enzyme M protein
LENLSPPVPTAWTALTTSRSPQFRETAGPTKDHTGRLSVTPWIMTQATSGKDLLPKLVTDAMKATETKFEPLKGVLPKDYGIFEPKVLEDLMRLFNSEQIRSATGDVFGRIYEYFLAKFSIQKAHDNGEFFTPSSLVQMIVNVIEPNHGRVFDPACGSGGMFVQTSHFIEHAGAILPKRSFSTAKRKTQIPSTLPS